MPSGVSVSWGLAMGWWIAGGLLAAVEIMAIAVWIIGEHRGAKNPSTAGDSD
jgi:hypothetical protein